VKSRRNALAILLLSGAYLFLRWRLLLNPGITFDLDLYKEWLTRAAEFGISQIYRTSRMDYPPLYAYILAPFGWLNSFLAARGLDSALVLTVLVKLPPLLFDFGIAFLVWRAMALQGKAFVFRATAAAAYLFNPAVLFLTAYWGGPDSIHSFFILAAFVVLAYGERFFFRSQAEPAQARTSRVIIFAWISLTLAALMKPLGLPYFPLLLFLSVMFGGVRRAFMGMAAAVITGLVIFLPFLIYGDAVEVFKRVIFDIGAMPFTSSNAHNFWWLIGAWYYSEAPWIGPLTPTHIGLILFLASYAALCLKIWRQRKLQTGAIAPAQVLAIAAMISFSFFIFSTHLHEHHLFAAVPLMASFAMPDRVWRKVFACLSVAVFVNCWLHDIPMDTPHWPYTLGGLTAIEHPPRFDRTYYVGELVAIWSSVAFNLVLYAVTMAGVLWPGKRNWLARLYVAAAGSTSMEETANVPHSEPDAAAPMV
jgi:Gpi18-like mannosyltransferase